jgi:hypothetical protein
MPTDRGASELRNAHCVEVVGLGSSSYTKPLGTNDWLDVGFSPRRAGHDDLRHPQTASSRSICCSRSSVRTTPGMRVST